MEVEEREERGSILYGLFVAPWSLTDPTKCLIAAASVIALTSLYVITEVRFLRRPEIAPFVNPDGLRRILVLHAVILAGWLAIGAVAFRRRGRERTPLLIHAVVQLYTIGFELIAWWGGAFSQLYLAVIISGGASVGFLFAEPAQMFWAFASGFVLMAGLTAAEQSGLVPYAPLFDQAPYSHHHLARSWLVGYAAIDVLILYLTAALVGIVSYRLRVRERLLTRTSEELARATDLISRYVAAQVAEQIRAGNWKLIDNTARRRVTIFFSDIQDFTPMAEEMEPEDLASLLNEYLSTMSEIAERYGGTIDKFVGDAIMIFFGAPLATDDQDHARRAVRMAVEMQEAAHELGRRWVARGLDQRMWVRMGINTGLASVGNFGSKGRVDYTAIGRQVNLAARLQASCKPGRILLSHATWLLVRDEFHCIPCGEIVLKGIRNPVPTYEVLTAPDATAPG